MPYLNEMPLEARLALLNRRHTDRRPEDILKHALALLAQKLRWSAHLAPSQGCCFTWRRKLRPNQPFARAIGLGNPKPNNA